MTWSYRVVVRNGEYAIYEVYYDEVGNVSAFTDEPVYPTGESLEELGDDMQYYQQALRQPVLDYDELSRQVTDCHTTRKILQEVKEKGTIPWHQVKTELNL